MESSDESYPSSHYTYLTSCGLMAHRLKIDPTSLSGMWLALLSTSAQSERSTLHSPTGFHGVHEDSVESTKNPHGLHEDSILHFLLVYMDSMETLCGLLMDSPWTPHGLSVDSKGLPYLI